MKRRIAKRRPARPAREEDEDEITSQSSAEQAATETRFVEAETPEQKRERLTHELLATAERVLADDPFFTPAPTAALPAAAPQPHRAAAFEERLLRGHRKPITAVAFAASGDVFTAGKDRALLVFRQAEAFRREVFSAGFPKDAEGHRDEVYCLETAPDGKTLASGGKDQLVRLWRAEGTGGRFIAELRGHQGPVHALCFRAEARELLSLSADRTLRIWALDQLAPVQTLFGHRAEPQGLAMLGGQSAVSVGYDRLPIVWRLDRETQVLFAPQQASLDCVAALDAHHFATGSEGGELCLWSTGKKRPIFRLPQAHARGWLSALAAAAGLLVSGGRDGTLNVYRVHLAGPGGAHLTRLAQLTAAGVVTALRLTPCGTGLAAVLASEDRLGRWNAQKAGGAGVRLISLAAHALPGL